MTQVGFGREKLGSGRENQVAPRLDVAAGDPYIASCRFGGDSGADRRNREVSSVAGRRLDPRVRSSTGREPREGEAKAKVSRGFPHVRVPSYDLVLSLIVSGTAPSASREILPTGRENQAENPNSTLQPWSNVLTSPIGETHSVGKPEGSRKRHLPPVLRRPRKGSGSKDPVRESAFGPGTNLRRHDRNRKRPRSVGSATSHNPRKRRWV